MGSSARSVHPISDRKAREKSSVIFFISSWLKSEVLTNRVGFYVWVAVVIATQIDVPGSSVSYFGIYACILSERQYILSADEQAGVTDFYPGEGFFLGLTPF